MVEIKNAAIPLSGTPGACPLWRVALRVLQAAYPRVFAQEGRPGAGSLQWIRLSLSFLGSPWKPIAGQE